jgi:hypothetical protein
MRHLQGLSTKYDSYIMLWDEDVAYFESTDDLKFSYRVQSGPINEYSTLRVVQILLSGKYQTAYRKSDGKRFRLVKKTAMI